jgi:hypothetical protein
MDNPSILVRGYLLYFILPLWIGAGLTDYFLHRHTQIEDTSGTKESVLHVLQLIEAGVPVIAGLLLEINALVLLLMLSALVLHEVTAIWDVKYAITRRYVGAVEQHIHSFLELLPLMGISFITILYWDQFQALFGLGREAARFGLQWKTSPLSPGYLWVLFSTLLVFIVLPYAEELWRCMRAGQQGSKWAEKIKRAA